MIWLRPEKLITNWLPESYTPEYLELYRFLDDPGNHFVALGDLFELHVPNYEQHDFENMWLVAQSRDTISIEKYRKHRNKHIVPLPEEALLVGRWFAEETLPSLYWNESSFGEGCYLVNDIVALIPKRPHLFMWVSSEFKKKYLQLQAMQYRNGTLLPYRLAVSNLLNLKLQLLPDEACAEQNWKANDEINSLANRLRESLIRKSAEHKVQSILLTGASFEERLKQFEEYLLQQNFVDGKRVFFIEPLSSDDLSFKYTVRQLQESITPGRTYRDVKIQYDEDLHHHWVHWFNQDKEERYKVFNITDASMGIPSYIYEKIASYLLNKEMIDRIHGYVVPSYNSYIDILSMRQNENTAIFHSKAGEIWKNLSFWTMDDIAASILDKIYAPALAIKIIRDDIAVGAFLIFADLQDETIPEIRATLEGYGSELLKLINQISDFSSDAARRESLRRLSGVMHRLNGPIGRAVSAIDDITIFLDANKGIADCLVPDDAKARNRANMTKESLECYSLSARLNDIKRSIQDIRKVSYQVRRLRLVQGNLEKTPHDISNIIDKCFSAMTKLIPELTTNSRAEGSYLVLVNEEVISSAIEEVLNNACRELKEQHVEEPSIVVNIWKNEEKIHISIKDNGLPESTKLISNPFDEDASTYARYGRGSGLGLAIVKETFVRHGGNCRLYENTDTEGKRVRGVTFEAILPEYIHDI